MNSPWSSFPALLRRQTGVKRELLIFAACLFVGLALMPFVIWILGRLTLGAYTSGGAFALWRDYLRSLWQGSMPFWGVALGPYLALGVLRILLVLLRRTVS